MHCRPDGPTVAEERAVLRLAWLNLFTATRSAKQLCHSERNPPTLAGHNLGPLLPTTNAPTLVQSTGCSRPNMNPYFPRWRFYFGERCQ